MNKYKFEINDYDFKIIKMDIFNNDDKENIFTYYLLVDEQNFIHDYKVEFHQIYITENTTLSHKNKFKKSNALIRREQLLEKLGLKNQFIDNKKNHKKYLLINNCNILNSINQWSYKLEWNMITFQHHEYLVKGSNSGGQGNGNGYFKIYFEEKKLPFGFFLQDLNISKQLRNTYIGIDYNLVWNKYQDFNDLKKVSINFENWLYKNYQLYDFFKQYKNNSSDWKNIKLKFKNIFQKEINKYIKLEKKISDLRKDFINNFDKYSNIINYFPKKIDNLGKLGYEHAHIKPVWYIKKEYLNSKTIEDKNRILKQISNKYNCLPLPPTIHSYYDKYYIYWDNSGNLVQLKDGIDPLEINNYLQINANILNKEIKFFLNEYSKKVLLDKNIKVN